MRTQEQHVEPAIAKATSALRRLSKLPVAFGGPVLPHGKAFVISALSGTNTRSLARLKVTAGMGLGGKALLLERPAKVEDYPNALGITHSYDSAVAPEQLGGVVAMPLWVNERPRAVLYLATRERMSLGDRVLDLVAPILRQVERDILVEEEVHRRVAELQQQPLAEPFPVFDARSRREFSAELRAIADSIADEELRARLTELCDRRLALAEPPLPPTVSLAKRECDVLRFAAIGHSNKQIADELGLLPNTVKSYVKTAIRKLDVSNRWQAACRARDAGLIRLPGTLE